MTPTPQSLREQAAELSRLALEMIKQAEAAEQKARDAAKPAEPAIGPNRPAFVTFVRRLGDIEYTYAAVGVKLISGAMRWYPTGRMRPARSTDTLGRSWEGLLDWIGESQWHTVRRLTLAPALDVTASGGAVVTSGGSVVAGGVDTMWTGEL